MVWATNERFLPVGFTFGFDLACERCWLQPVVVLTVRWWPTPVSVGGLLANPNRGCSHSSHNVFGGHVNILFNVEVEIITMLIKWSYSSPQTSHTTCAHTHEYIVACWACNGDHILSMQPISFEDMSFWYPFLKAKSHHIPLKYSCPIKTSSQIRHVYSCGLVVHIFQLLESLWPLDWTMNHLIWLAIAWRKYCYFQVWKSKFRCRIYKSSSQ